MLTTGAGVYTGVEDQTAQVVAGDGATVDGMYDHAGDETTEVVPATTVLETGVQTLEWWSAQNPNVFRRKFKIK